MTRHMHIIGGSPIALLLSLICLVSADHSSAQDRGASSYQITTIAGNGKAGDVPSTVSGVSAATAVPVDLPFGVEIGPRGHLFITTVGSHRVLRMHLKTGRLRSVAGSGKPGYAGDGGPATQARLNEPYEVRFDSAGNLLILEMRNHLIRRVDARTGRISTVAGDGVGGDRGDGGPARLARFRHPHSLILDKQDNIYVADLSNHRVRRIDARTGRITTIAGNGKPGMPPDGGRAAEHPLRTPQGLAVAGNQLWIASFRGQVIWRLDLQSGRIRRIAGTGRRGYVGDGGDPRKATLDGPRGITLAAGVLYIVEGENNVIRALDIQRNALWTIAGAGPDLHRYNGDGKAATRAALWQPHGVCVDRTGRVILSDTKNHRVRRLVRPR